LALGTISAVVNLGILGQAVQSPFAALTLIYNAALARTVLKETYTRYDLYSTLWIIAGVGLAVGGATMSDIESQLYTLDNLLDLFFRDSLFPPLYTVVTIAVVLTVNTYIKRNKKESTAFGLFHFSVSAGLMAGFTSMAVKSSLEIVKGAFDNETNAWTWVGLCLFILAIPCALIPQLFYMNEGLKYFGTLKFGPLYQCFLILGNMFAGMVYFREMEEYSTISKVLFFTGCSITLIGVRILLAKVGDEQNKTKVDPEEHIDIETIDWVDSCDFLTDFDQCKKAIVELFTQAESTIYYSTFLCDLFFDMPTPEGGTVTMMGLIQNAVDRGVKVHILYNPILDYGTANVEDILKQLPAEVNLRNSVSNFGPNWLTKHFSNNSRYAFHHQKYICVDGDIPNQGKIMVTGCDVNEERNGWLKKNTLGYFWHELSVVTNCTKTMYDWVLFNHNAEKRINYDEDMKPAPFPLVNGGWQEENVMVNMILKAKHSIHLENQIFISGGAEQENRISLAIVDRIVRGIAQDDDFYAMVLTNAAQQDEPSKVTQWYCSLTIEWSIRGMIEIAKQRGLTEEQLFSRLLVGRLEHNDILVKVHSNFIIQDGYRCIRTSSNLADRSLSHRPCDAETGIMVKGDCVAEFQQRLFNMYFNTTDEKYSMQTVREKVENGIDGCCIKKMEIRGWSLRKCRSIMKFFVFMSGGATGGSFKVEFESYNAEQVEESASG
jgi:phosphatidylserine/phosphatidylglycerophosphate/cardiolipin synthase-like enzyme